MRCQKSKTLGESFAYSVSPQVAVEEEHGEEYSQSQGCAKALGAFVECGVVLSIATRMWDVWLRCHGKKPGEPVVEAANLCRHVDPGLFGFLVLSCL